MSDPKISLVSLADLPPNSSVAVGSAVDVSTYYEVTVRAGHHAVLIEPDDGQAVDEDQLRCILASGALSPGEPLDAVNQRLRKCPRPARARWVLAPEPRPHDHGGGASLDRPQRHADRRPVAEGWPGMIPPPPSTVWGSRRRPALPEPDGPPWNIIRGIHGSLLAHFFVTVALPEARVEVVVEVRQYESGVWAATQGLTPVSVPARDDDPVGVFRDDGLQVLAWVAARAQGGRA
jgi:hypothetical protein